MQSAKGITLLLFGFLGPIAIVTVYFWATNGVSQWAYDTVGWLLEGGYANTSTKWYFLDGLTKFSILIKQPEKSLSLLPFLGVLLLQGALPVLGLIWPLDIIFRYCGRFETRHWLLLLLWCGGIGFFAANFSYPNTILVALHSGILYVLAWVAIFSCVKRNSRLAKVLAIGVITLFLVKQATDIPLALRLLNSPRILSFGTLEQSLLPNMGAGISPQAINALIFYLNRCTQPSDTLFAYNTASELYLMSNRQNATPYQFLLAVYNTPKQIEDTAQFILQNKPKFIVYDGNDRIDFQYDLRFQHLRQFDYRLKPIETVLDQNYLPVVKVAQWVVHQRKSDPVCQL